MDVCDAARVVQPADTGEGGRRGLYTQWYPQGQSECVVGGDWRRDQGLGYRGPLKEGGLYDLDFDHQFIEAEKFDSKPTFKKFLGYRPGVAVIGDTIVGIENRRTKQEQRQSLLWLCLARRRKPKGQQRR